MVAQTASATEANDLYGRPIGHRAKPSNRPTGELIETGTKMEDSASSPLSFNDGRAVNRAAAIGSQAARVDDRVNGVVSFVSPTSISITVIRPDGEFDVRFPASLVAEELRAFGQAVEISLGDRNGYRAPIIVGRQVERQDVPELESLKGWLPED